MIDNNNEGRPMNTMTKTIAIMSTLLFSACAAGPKASDVGCEYEDIETVKVKFRRNNGISVSKPEAEVYAGDLLHFRLIGNSARKVTVDGESGRGAWLDRESAGNNSGNDRHIYICVEESEIDEDPYMYELIVEAVGRLDPAVRVRR